MIIILLLLGLAALAIVVTLPIWPYSADWGYFPASILTLIPLLLFFLWIFDVL